MWPNPHEIEDLVTLTEISLIEDFTFYAAVFKTLKTSPKPTLTLILETVLSV